MNKTIKNILEWIIHIIPALFIWITLKFPISFEIKLPLMLFVLALYLYDILKYFIIDLIKSDKEIFAKNKDINYYLKAAASLIIIIFFFFNLFKLIRIYSSNLNDWVWNYGNEGMPNIDESIKESNTSLKNYNTQSNR